MNFIEAHTHVARGQVGQGGMPRRILVFHDSPAFGGHERAFLLRLPFLLRSERIGEVHIAFFARNVSLARALERLDSPKLRLYPSRHAATRASVLTAPLRPIYRRSARRLYDSIQPDTVLLLQGRIEATTVPMLALPAAADLVSYIPMAHSGQVLGRSTLLTACMDIARRRYYERPDRFIVPSRGVAAQLRQAGASATISVSPNVVTRHAGRPGQETRRALGLPLNRSLALFLGRFDAWQKGIDLLLAAMTDDVPRLRNWFFLFVGEGAAERSIRAVLRANPLLSGAVMSWTEQGRDLLAASDVLLMPSRFEGVPLLMLEALSDGVPILASDIDVFREFLPPASLWDFASPPHLQQRLDQAVAEGPARLGTERGTDEPCDIASSARLFEDALLGAAAVGKAEPPRSAVRVCVD